jgi:hypothetical protein
MKRRLQLLSGVVGNFGYEASAKRKPKKKATEKNK